MKNYRMTIQYDGTRYSGWQRQGNTDRSIQGKIEEVLSKMCGHRVEIHGSGRTDAGVHAAGQVASFRLECDRSDCEILAYLNKYLPEDIAVTELCEADERFHARLNARQKTYIYRINNANISRVFERKYLYTVKELLDVALMRTAAERFIGEHDFLGFSSLGKSKKTTVRTIYSVDIRQEGALIEIYISGSGFLYNTVRIIAGTLIEAGLGKRAPESIAEVFEKKDRTLAGFTAPACGLILHSVEY